MVTSLFKSRQTGREPKLKLVEFLYFYLSAETADADHTHTRGRKGESKSAGNTEVLGGRGRELIGAFRKEEKDRRESATVGGPVGGVVGLGGGDGGEGMAKTRTPEEKQGLLSRYLGNVQDLVDDMRDASHSQAVGGLLSRPTVSPVRA